ncbi:MAG: MFS transporter [Planctomycetes bacterium]|nr:MFS transporter [Planctomycetota bacterium]
MNNEPDELQENPGGETDNPSYLSYAMRARLKIRDRYREVKSYYSRKNVIAGVIGNVLEWYDFAVFGYFAPIIGAHFFPSNNRLTSLLSAFGVFAIGYFARPIGGIIFGRMGDKAGRKVALQISVMLMAIPTFLISVLPTYAQIGMLAPILLIILRLLQGISVGGEFIGSICFTTETAPANERGFWGSWTQGSLIGGILLGSLVAAIIQAVMPPESLASWGWRLPFLAGLGIGIFGLWMRTGLSESSDFTNTKETTDASRNPIMDAIREFPLRIFHIAMLVILSGGGFYLLFVWWPTFLEDEMSPPINYAFATNVISMLILMLMLPVTGWLSDKCGRKALLILGSLSMIIAAYPLFMLIKQPTFGSVLAAQLTFAVLLSLFMGPVSTTLAEMFPSRVRYSGIALGYNISLSLFGGTAPLIATWLVFHFNDMTVAAYYLMVMAFISLMAALTLNKGNSSEMDKTIADKEEITFK